MKVIKLSVLMFFVITFLLNISYAEQQQQPKPFYVSHYLKQITAPLTTGYVKDLGRFTIRFVSSTEVEIEYDPSVYGHCYFEAGRPTCNIVKNLPVQKAIARMPIVSWATNIQNPMAGSLFPFEIQKGFIQVDGHFVSLTLQRVFEPYKNTVSLIVQNHAYELSPDLVFDYQP